MSRARAHPPTLFRRLLRSATARVVMLVLMVPLLAIGPFCGTSFLSHEHDEEGVHGHAGPTHVVMQDVAGWHASEHGVSPDNAAIARLAERNAGDELSVEGNEQALESPSGLLVSSPVHEHLLVRGIDLSQALKSAQVAHGILAWFCLQAEFPEDHEPGGASDGNGPRHLLALTAGDRIVRTSRALLI